MEQLKTKESSLFAEGSRERLRYKFLQEVGLETETLVPLPIDCSRRQYFRLPQAILMDAPPNYENTRQFDRIARLLHDVGLSVPKIYAADHTCGFLLVEDFGTISYRHAIRSGIEEALLYEEVIKALAHLHQYSFPETTKKDVPSYTEEMFLKNVSLFLEWFPHPPSDSAKEEFHNLWKEAYQKQPSLPETLMLRDVMIDNLLWLPHRTSFQKCGFIDFQDASWGPPSYDLASVLGDARREPLPSPFIQKMLTLYFQHFPTLSEEEFLSSFYLWGAQRATRIIGLFHRLAERDEKPLYLAYLPNIWRILEQNLQHPSLHGLQAWFRRHGDFL